jgi:preprotein translocase subunit SecB
LFAVERRVSHTADCTAKRHNSPTSQFEGEFIVSTTNGGPAADTAANPAPQLMVLAQYIKDFSFENPNAPASLQQSTQPQINISVNVGAKPMTDTDIEVTLRLEGKAEAAGSVLFNIELEFAGVFRIQNVPAEQVQPIVLIECPRLLFPFAREIIATTVRNGGFSPLMLDPIDFVALYQQRMAQVPPPPATA